MLRWYRPSRKTRRRAGCGRHLAGLVTTGARAPAAGSRPGVKIQHQPQILYRRTGSSLAEIVETGNEHGMMVPIVCAHVQIEPVGLIECLRFEAALPVADHNRYVFRTRVKGA